MTVNQLIKKLQALKEQHGNLPVAAAAQELLDFHNGVFNTVDIRGAYVDLIELCDGDGFVEYRKDGQARIRRMIVLGIEDFPPSYFDKPREDV